VEDFRAILFFRASASCSKILKDKKYKFNVVNLGQILFFRARSHSSDNTGRFRESDHTIRKRRFWNIALRHRSPVHICISKSNYRKVSCLGEHNTQGTSTPYVNNQGNYRICL